MTVDLGGIDASWSGAITPQDFAGSALAHR
jgi:hypothetical protein